jgi:hypothetical protein
LIPVELAPEATASLRAMKDGGTPPPRCHKGVINSAIAGGVRRLIDGSLSGGVRPWDLQALQRRATGLGEVSSARAVSVDESVLVAELLPDGQRIVFRGVGGEWRLVRFADDGDVSIRPETTRRVELRGCGPDAVLAALRIAKPDGVELEVVSEDLGQGETETSYRYQWSDGGRSILAEESRTRFTTAPRRIRPMFGV